MLLGEGERRQVYHIHTRFCYGWELHPTILNQNEAVGPTLAALRAIGEERWSCVFCKRALLLKACEVADALGARAVVMGDALGQVASQTLANVEVISFNIPKPILRPLIGMDKTEIVNLARRIGTFETSTSAEERCPFLPRHPITRGSIEKLQRIMRRLEEMETNDE